MIWYKNLEQLGITPEHAYYDLFTTDRLMHGLTQLFSTVNIRPLSQGISIALDHEQLLLQGDDQNCWIREVAICSSHTSIVHARTVIPYALYRMHQTILDDLGSKPIGDTFLYKQPHTRGEFEYCAHNNNICRRSIFTIAEHKILLFEDFSYTKITD